MKILILDELISRRSQILEAFEKSKHKATACLGSNEFITALDEQSWDCLCIDFDSWHHGRSIYNYLKIPKKTDQVPMVLFNTPPNISGLSNRARHEQDRVLPKPVEVKAIIDAVLACA